ncbi:uncharacterized protein B0T15DRAFT_500144 [Chaetomium strumarium]|uniref:Uncharacterized protein n=1 Tax=Chaetomium strumarium TaxID=1170767 RepID=A0AAJ0M434_9PEZI|nr:hypothetical protein B0T15DRAFT_500144 [Chaetomium strumarium]
MGQVKKTYRWLADKGGEAGDLVSKVPDMGHVSAVKAVVEVLLQAAKTASRARHTITGMVDGEDLDQTFAKIEVFLATFPDDQNIIDRSIELVACILKAVEGTIVYFLTNTFKRGAQSMPLIGNGQQPLLDTLAEIQTRSQQLINEATVSHFAATRAAMELILEDISKIELVEIETAGRIEYIIQRGTEQVLGGISELKDSSFQQADKLNEMLSMLAQSARPWPPVPFPYYPYATTQQAPVIPASTLLAVLNILGLDQTDIDVALELEGSVPPSYRNHARQIVAASQFQLWATSPGSSKLLIQGEPQRDAAQASLALSLMSASLVRGPRALNLQERIISLVFFCGQHVESDDSPSGPAAVLRSLIAQLLLQHYADATFRPEDIDLDRLARGGLAELCWLFGFLVRHVAPQKTVVCVLDGLAVYDTDSFEHDMRTVLNCLLGDLGGHVSGPAAKILATAVGGTSFDGVFGEEDESVLVLEGLTRLGEDAAMLEFDGDF